MKLIAFSLLITLCLTQSYTGVFAFSWIAGFCQYEAQQKHQTCQSSLIAPWDNQSFTIHGLWPQLNSTESFGSFNVQLLEKNTKLLDDMHNYFPPKSKASSTASFLWDHEWTTHGKDYANIVYKLRPQDFPGTVAERNAALQLSFYNDIINFYKKFSVKKMPSKSYTKAAMASRLGITEQQFKFQCSKGTTLRELQVCFEITKTGIFVANCLKTTTSCSGGGLNVDLPGWAVKPQTRVFDYAKISQSKKNLVNY